MKGLAAAALVAVGGIAAAVFVLASCSQQSSHPGELGNCTPSADGSVTCTPVSGGGSGGSPGTDAGADADAAIDAATDATADATGDDGSSDAASE